MTNPSQNAAEPTKAFKRFWKTYGDSFVSEEFAWQKFLDLGCDKAIKAEALREAAAYWQERGDTDEEQTMCKLIVNWLKERADELERQ